MRQFTVPPCLPRAERDAVITEIVADILRATGSVQRAQATR